MNEKTPSKLGGLRIAVTRETTSDLAQLLAIEGATVVHCPLVRIDFVSRADLAGDYDWIVLTSGHGARALLQSGREPGPLIACVGQATAYAAEDAGLEVELVSKRAHVKGLIEEFAKLPKQSGRVLYPCSDIAPPTLKEGLQALGFEVVQRVGYLNEPHQEGMVLFAQAIKDGGLDAITFASPSAVINGAKVADMSGLPLYSIGPTTSAAIRDAGLTVKGEADDHSMEGLTRAVIEGERGG